MADWREKAAEEYLRKRQQAHEEHVRLVEARAQIDERLREIVDEVNALDQAANTFELDLVLQHTGPESGQLFGEDGTLDQKGFKDLTIDLMEQVYPKGIRASEVRAQIERLLRRQFHEKTAGMTLYRLSQEYLVRRDGLLWYWVPPEDRNDLRLLDESEEAEAYV